MEHLRPPPELDFSSSDGNLPEKWRKWEQTMRLYLNIAMHERDEKDKCSAFLYIIGQDGREIFNTMTILQDDKDKIEPLFKKFKDYCAPRENITVWRHKFYTRQQGKTETIDQYVTDLRVIAKNCKFGALENDMLRDRIVCGVNSEKVKERLLRDNKLTLESALSACRASEESVIHLKDLHSEEATAAAVFKKPKDKHSACGNWRNKKKPGQSTTAYVPKGSPASRDKKSCGRCGKTHEEKKCPAFGKRCHRCNGANHYQKCCRSKNVNVVDHEDDEDCHSTDDENYFLCAVTRESDRKDEAHTTIAFNKVKVKFKIDTGSQVKIIPRSILSQLPVKTNVTRTSARITSYTGDKIPILGKCHLRHGNHVLEFYVTETDSVPILGLRSCRDLGLVKLTFATQKQSKDYSKEDIFSKFTSVFRGLGCLQEPYHIQIDSTVEPVVHPPRTFPAALRDELKASLEGMELKGVIKKVDEPTEWVNSIVCAEKSNGKLRICLDPRDLNKAIKREYYQLPTIEEITTRLAGAKIFSKLDANSGYWQIPLDPASQKLTTFNTPFGRYCFCRMPFGIKSAQELFQKRISQHFRHIPGVEVDIDDILVWGENREQHDQRLRQVLERCKEINLTLNKEKCMFRSPEVSYIGHIISSEGVRPDPKKIEAITKMPPPEDKKGVERLLGTINYLAKFIPNMSKVTQPIRTLLRKDITFHWERPQEDAFKDIKKILSEAPILTFFDVKKPVVVSVDASKFGLGAVILQENKPIAYASRALTDAETRYAQIEKELLAVTFGLERFNQYTYGVDIVVENDHKPLESILKKPLSQAPPRLQRLLLRLQKYTFNFKYRPGKELVIADTLSRACLPVGKEETQSQELETFVHSVFLRSIPMSHDILNDIYRETERDNELSLVRDCIQNDWPLSRKRSTHKYWKIKDQLTVVDDLVFKGNRIVVPTVLQPEILKRLHTGHMGMEKTKRRARNIIYWPNMNRDIDEIISQCNTCMDFRNQNPKEPLVSTPVPDGPWQTVGTDLFTLHGSDYLVVTDYYSRFFEVVKLPNTQSRTVTERLKSMFARYGIPFEVISDNGTQYTSQEFREFAQNWNFQHTTSSPYHQQANGLAERTVQTAKRLLEKAKTDGKDPYLGLLEYRNTPTDTGSPAQLLMSRELRSILPITKKQLRPKTINRTETYKERARSQYRQQYYYNRTTKSQKEIPHGHKVRFKLKKDWKPANVIAQDNRSYQLITPDGAMYRRNRGDIITSKEKMFRKDTDISTDEEPNPDVSQGEVVDTKKPNLLTSEVQPSSESGYRTRSGREVRKPKRFED